jgi:hypothetical protein
MCAFEEIRTLDIGCNPSHWNVKGKLTSSVQSSQDDMVFSLTAPGADAIELNTNPAGQRLEVVEV